MIEEFKTGECVKIRNRSGVLRVFIDSEMSLSKIAKGGGINSLPSFDQPRLEFHDTDDETLVTLCERQSALPCDMYLFLIRLDGKVLAYKGHFDSGEEDDNAFFTILDE